MEVRPQEDKLRAGWEHVPRGERVKSGWWVNRQQFGWEMESLASTKQSFCVILPRHRQLLRPPLPNTLRSCTYSSSAGM